MIRYGYLWPELISFENLLRAANQACKRKRDRPEVARFHFHLGLPLGNQTSQFFANVYLDPLDHIIQDRWRAGGYVRYLDDFLVFGDSSGELHRLRSAITHFLGGLRLGERQEIV